eukprot:276647-Pelagomonas_calceolata.AAC.3
MASPLDCNSLYLHYWSSEPRDILVGAHHNSLSSKFSGISIFYPIFDDKALTLALQHAIYSAILHTDATATFMFLPASKNFLSLKLMILAAYPHFCYKLNTPGTYK